MSTKFGDNGVAIERLDVSAHTVSTDSAESVDTYAWDKTTIIIVEVSAGGKSGRSDSPSRPHNMKACSRSG